MAIEHHQKVACGPLVIKAAKRHKEQWRERERAADVIRTLLLLCLQPNSKYLKTEACAVL